MKTYEVNVYDNGSVEWLLNGKKHREDGPAVTYIDGAKYWYINGECHREDGPATITSEGNKTWYKNGKIHREDGPAYEGADGSKAWYIGGEELTEEEFNNHKVKELTMDELEKLLGHKVKIIK